MTAQLQSGLISIQAHILGLQTEFPTSCNTYPNLYQMRNNTMSIEQYIKQLEADIKEEALDALSLPTGARLAYDIGKNPVVLFQNEWSANYFGETNKGIVLSTLPVQTARE